MFLAKDPSESYKDVPVTTIILATTAINHFVSQADHIPDWIPVAGYLDDATVVACAAYSIQGDLEKFGEWEKK